MLANDLAELVLVEYEKLNNADAPGVQDEVMSIVLTNAQLLYVISRIQPITNSLQQGLEETEIRNQGLSGLYNAAILTPNPVATALNLTNGKFVDLPRDFMLCIYEKAVLDRNYCHKDQKAEVGVRVISHNDFEEQRFNPFRKPFFDGYTGSVWRLNYAPIDVGYASNTYLAPSSPNFIDGYDFLVGSTNKRHELITDGDFEVDRYYIRYLRYPRKIVVDTTNPTNQRNPELDEFVQRGALVSVAVDLLKTYLSQPKDPMTGLNYQLQ
jgi:hypothetical protein